MELNLFFFPFLGSIYNLCLRICHQGLTCPHLSLQKILFHSCVSLPSILSFVGHPSLSRFMFCTKISSPSNRLWKLHSFFCCSTLSIPVCHVCGGVLRNSSGVPSVYMSFLSPKQGWLTPGLWNKTRYQTTRWLSHPTFSCSFSIVLALLIYCITRKLWESLSIFPEQLTRTLLVLHWKWIYKSIELGRIDTLAILSLHVYSHRVVLYLFRNSLFSFIMFHRFSYTNSYSFILAYVFIYTIPCF